MYKQPPTQTPTQLLLMKFLSCIFVQYHKEVVMPKARKHQISLDATPYYHCVTRCVRRAFLCGIDSVTGQSFEHKRQWLEDRILTLAQIFAIDVAAYALANSGNHALKAMPSAMKELWPPAWPMWI